MSAERLRRLEGLAPQDVPADELGLLRLLGGPTAIALPGRDRSRVRAVVTLLHGNEPSGLRAVHRWLRSGRQPAVDALVVVASIDAALADRPFTCRVLPGEADLNRRFAEPFEGAAGALAREILELLFAARPEALVDIHNNSGHNPTYSVGVRGDPAELALAALFGERFVHYDLRLGALLERTAALFSTIVVEAGRAGDPRADDAAAEGLARFLGASRVVGGIRGSAPLEVFVDPVRVEIRPGLSVGFADAPCPGVELTVAEDVDRHNFETLVPGTRIGWIVGGASFPIRAWGADGRDRAPELFTLRDGQLVTRTPLVPIMMTASAEIAVADCLCYLVRRVPAEQMTAEACRDEILRMHRVIEGWLAGRLAQSDSVYGEFADALAAEFMMVVPDGRELSREALVERFRHRHGAVPDLRIEIRNVVLRAASGELAVASYEEWQFSGEGTSARLSTAVFERSPESPGGLSWRHLHETWQATA